MQRGPKAQLPSEKKAKGTYQPVRDAGRIQIIEPASMPQRPDWLTSEAGEVWLDDVGRVRLVTEADSTLFANYCTLQGGIIKAIRAGGEFPPISAFAEVRKMQEVLGIGGARSRIGVKPEGGKTNVFGRNGSRS